MEKKPTCVCERERMYESLCVCVCVCVRMCEFVSECEREYVCEFVCEGGRESHDGVVERHGNNGEEANLQEREREGESEWCV